MDIQNGILKHSGLLMTSFALRALKVHNARDGKSRTSMCWHDRFSHDRLISLATNTFRLRLT